jgi:hypothetical protein
MLIPPTLEEVKRAAREIGLPHIEAEKFFNHYCSNGWKVGRTKMVSFSHALANWKINWSQWGSGKSNSELERILEELRVARGQVCQDAIGTKHYRPGQLQRIKALVAKRDQLRRELGL